MRILSRLAKCRLLLQGKLQIQICICAACCIWRHHSNAAQLYYSVLKYDAFWAHQWLLHTCAYAPIVIFKSTAHKAIYSVKKTLHKSRYNLDLASPLRICIDLDWHSGVASPNPGAPMLPCYKYCRHNISWDFHSTTQEEVKVGIPSQTASIQRQAIIPHHPIIPPLPVPPLNVTLLLVL